MKMMGICDICVKRKPKIGGCGQNTIGVRIRNPVLTDLFPKNKKDFSREAVTWFSFQIRGSRVSEVIDTF